MAEPKNPTRFRGAGWWWRLPPIDWDALAIEMRENSRWCRRGVKRPLEDVRKALVTRARNQKAKTLAATERHLAMRRRKVRPEFTLAHRIALAMQRGGWYGRSDVMRLASIAKNIAKGKLADMRTRGLVERVRNPEWRAQELLPGEGVHQLPPERRSPPVWLYRLTEAGLMLRREAEYLA